MRKTHHIISFIFLSIPVLFGGVYNSNTSGAQKRQGIVISMPKGEDKFYFTNVDLAKFWICAKNLRPNVFKDMVFTQETEFKVMLAVLSCIDFDSYKNLDDKDSYDEIYRLAVGSFNQESLYINPDRPYITQYNYLTPNLSSIQAYTVNVDDQFFKSELARLTSKKTQAFKPNDNVTVLHIEPDRIIKASFKNSIQVSNNDIPQQWKVVADHLQKHQLIFIKGKPNTIIYVYDKKPIKPIVKKVEVYYLSMPLINKDNKYAKEFQNTIIADFTHKSLNLKSPMEDPKSPWIHTVLNVFDPYIYSNLSTAETKRLLSLYQQHNPQDLESVLSALYLDQLNVNTNRFLPLISFQNNLVLLYINSVENIENKSFLTAQLNKYGLLDKNQYEYEALRTTLDRCKESWVIEDADAYETMLSSLA